MLQASVRSKKRAVRCGEDSGRRSYAVGRTGSAMNQTPGLPFRLETTCAAPQALLAWCSVQLGRLANLARLHSPAGLGAASLTWRPR